MLETVKIVFLGASSVGKTSIINWWKVGSFNPNLTSTVGLNYDPFEIDCGNVKYSGQLWDTAGQDNLLEMTRNFLRNSTLGVIVYDVTNSLSFEVIPKYIDVLRDTEPSVPFIIVGNKIDKTEDIEVSDDALSQLGNKYNVQTLKCSAKNGWYINEVMDTAISLAVDYLNSRLSTPHMETRDAVDIANPPSQQPAKKNQQCCK